MFWVTKEKIGLQNIKSKYWNRQQRNSKYRQIFPSAKMLLTDSFQKDRASCSIAYLHDLQFLILCCIQTSFSYGQRSD